MAPPSLQPHSHDSQAKDFTRVLPFQLSMSILGFLDQKSLNACSAVNGHWAFLVRQLREDQECRSTVQKTLLQLKELCPRKAIPNYAKRVHVQIPQLNDEGEVMEEKEKEQKKRRKSKTEDFSLHEAYQGLKTRKIELEERNVFCGPYKTHVLLEQSARSRRAHCSGGDWVAAAHRRVRLLGLPVGQDVPLLLRGPCRAPCLLQDQGLLLSTTSRDLSIRCWDIHSGACVRTFSGHYATITCLHSHQEHFVSGAEDGMVKVWSLKSGKCVRTLMHSSPVWAVRMDGTHVVSGGHRGLVKVWSADSGALIKTLERHQGPVLCLSFDQWHLVTGSSDGYALGWSMLGKFRRCLIAFFHPKEVLSLEFLYLRVISGCADGHIRIFSFLTGVCLQVLQPSSSGDPVSALYVAGNRVVTNSPSRLLLLQFEAVVWDYSLPADREVVKKEKSQKGKREGASAEQQRAQDKSPRPRQPPKSCGRPKSTTPSPCFPGFSKLSYKPSSHCLQPSQYSDSLLLSRADVLFHFNVSVIFQAYMKPFCLFTRLWCKFNRFFKIGAVIFQLSKTEISSSIHIHTAGGLGNTLLIQALNYSLQTPEKVREHLHSGSAITGKGNCTETGTFSIVTQ